MHALIHFLGPGDIPASVYAVRHDPALVAASVATAFVCAIVVFELIERMAGARTTRSRLLWLVPGSLIFGGGVWATHFIAMVGLSLPDVTTHDTWMRGVSVMSGTLAASGAFYLIGARPIVPARTVLSGVMIGLAIAVIHYTAMAAMRTPFPVMYDPIPFTASIAAAIGLSVLALFVKGAPSENPVTLRVLVRRSVGALILGSAIVATHYVADQGTYYFSMRPEQTAGLGFEREAIGFAVTAVTFLIMITALIGAIISRHVETIGRLRIEIAERKKAEIRIRKLSRAVEQSPVSVMITDLDGHLEYVNPKFLQATGYTTAEVIGRNPRFLKSGTMSKDQYRELWRTISSGGEWRGEMHNIRKDGSRFWEYASISPIRDPDGKIVSYLAVKEDITDRKAAEDDLLRAKEQAEYADHAKTQFLASMSHELRTPLNAIIGFSDLLMHQDIETLGNKKYRGYVSDINAAGQHLLEIITDILDMSKIESETLELHEETIDLNAILQTCEHLALGQAEDKNIHLALELAETPLLLLADRLRVKQIFINLLGNAIKFTPQNGRIVTRSALLANGALKVTVSDNGIGMSPEDIPHALEPFGQLTDTASHPHEGVGLGLYLARVFTEKHGGTLSIESNLGKGTRISVVFPGERIFQAA
ncbi:ATP-binding protein [Varunaivibrio sulfuroxidans]|uniref:histidine kinase n=1 Tax=Varunaivibrio sulfuroxidans TaxID=1773489 RepID=A0A4R3JIG9_9PROT|nr:ATP-binding protein [Varunaivibrio sulfuroxidans]TCS65076.1 PAS domain S-box-containing protein [Varunaivibrio sulfuroxidans]WES29637.1 PAS domain S-box protein [Varunaivibrio sulfuroxidans]